METKLSNAENIENSIIQMLNYIGENPLREGLKDTPKRIVKMWNEIYRGYDLNQKPKITTFDNGKDGIIYDEMIIDTGNYYSMCEHHILPFFGKYIFAYIPHPQGKIIGISKIARLVDYHSAKLQIQERLTNDILFDIKNELIKETNNEPLGLALSMSGEHLCKTMRGVKKQGTTTTTVLDGLFKTNSTVRHEFLKHTNI